METSLNDMSETNGLNEENLSSLKGMLHQLFHLEDKDLRTYSPLTLAYIGDGVYELVIRTILVKRQLSGKPASQKSQQSGQGRNSVFHDGSNRAHAYRGGTQRLQKRKECSFSYNGQTCNHGRLPQGNRV